MEHAIVLKNLCKNYKDFSLKNINFSVPKGCIMGFIGENGAGKTTTLKAILGLIHIDGGSVEVLGKNPFTQRREINTDIGAVLDNSFFYEGMRTKDISSVMAKLHPAWDSALFVRYCERFALPAAKSIKEYSKGMKAKLSLATALSHHPKLLILDEPFVGLDPQAAFVMKNYLREICDAGGAVIFSTHVLEVAEKLCDKIAIIRDGKLVEVGTTADIVGNSSLEHVFLELAQEGEEHA
ncbi:MAG: ABC transporter ATP-binding protein [Ruthenibacterium sp.]